MGKSATVAKQATSKLAGLKAGSILSESSFFIVKKILPGSIVVSDEHGNDNITLGNKYVEKILSSADYYDREEVKTRTELIEIFDSNPRIAMAVGFYEKDKEKLVRDYKSEVEAAKQAFVNAKMSELPIMVQNLIENPITRTTPGAFREMKGRHYGSYNEHKRMSFIDMEVTKDNSASYDNRTRQVDPRTIEYIIVNGCKYNLKK